MNYRPAIPRDTIAGRHAGAWTSILRAPARENARPPGGRVAEGKCAAVRTRGYSWPVVERAEGDFRLIKNTMSAIRCGAR